MNIRIFYLFRKEDESGVSGIGFVAEGVQFSGGKCAIWWRTEHTSVTVYDDIAVVEAIHGHTGKTILVFDDLDFVSPDGDIHQNDGNNYYYSVRKNTCTLNGWANKIPDNWKKPSEFLASVLCKEKTT